MPVFTQRHKNPVFPHLPLLFPILGLLSLFLFEAAFGLGSSLDIVELEAVSDLAPQPSALVGLLLGDTLHILWNTRHRGHVQEHLGLPRTPFSSHLPVPFTVNLKTCPTVNNLMSEINLKSHLQYTFLAVGSEHLRGDFVLI